MSKSSSFSIDVLLRPDKKENNAKESCDADTEIKRKDFNKEIKGKTYTHDLKLTSIRKFFYISCYGETTDIISKLIQHDSLYKHSMLSL